MGTIALSIHGWRNPAFSYDLFMAFLVVGFLTIGVSRFVLRDKLQGLRDAMRGVRG